jgi:hypothetical protein
MPIFGGAIGGPVGCEVGAIYFRHTESRDDDDATQSTVPQLQPTWTFAPQLEPPRCLYYYYG